VRPFRLRRARGNQSWAHAKSRRIITIFLDRTPAEEPCVGGRRTSGVMKTGRWALPFCLDVSRLRLACGCLGSNAFSLTSFVVAGRLTSTPGRSDVAICGSQAQLAGAGAKALDCP